MPVFNCSAPGNCFTGYERLRRGILSGLSHGKSYAILGGRRCGKTSLLLQLEKDLQCERAGPFNLQPRFLDIQALGQVTPERLFKAMLKRIAPELNTPPSFEPGDEYETFLGQLDEIQPELRKEHGNDFLLILLVDELDAAIASLPNDQFFQNLRNLLMVSRYNRHFRLVASGVREMGRLISSGSSPLNNLSHQYLRPLEKPERNELVRKGFPGGLPDPLMEKMEDLCGGHSYVWQGLLEKLETTGEVSSTEFSPTTAERAGREFLREHKDFRRWLDGFTACEREVYKLLAQAPAGQLKLNELQRGLSAESRADLEESLTTLGFHCLIDDSNPDQPAISGTLFRNWFLQQTHAEVRSATSPQSPGAPTRRQLVEELLGTPSDAPFHPPGEVSLPNLKPHDVLQERYEVRRLLGQGGNGTVFAVWDRNRDKEIALKILRPGLLPDPRARERFLLEARVASDLSHPNIVNVYDVHRQGGDYFLTMELLVGNTLRQEISERSRAGRTFSLPEVIGILQALCQGLEYAHRFAVHRDIKPENIFLPSTGGLKIMDFGLARAVGTQGITTVNLPLGTPYYMAPEQLRNENVDGRADQYSAAVVAYELLTGELPMGMAQPVHSVRPEVPLTLSQAVAKGLSTKPEQRFQSIDAFLAAFQEPSFRLQTPGQGSSPNVVTIMFTDVVGSTEMTSAMGDLAAQEIVRAHNQIVREVLQSFQGVEIKHTGDGIMASFHSASNAVHAALLIRTNIAHSNARPGGPKWNIRIGLNSGEPINEGNDLFGATVQLAARTCAAAKTGQVVITGVVRGLCSGKKFEFTDLGKHELKGIPEPVELFEARSG